MNISNTHVNMSNIPDSEIQKVKNVLISIAPQYFPELYLPSEKKPFDPAIPRDKSQNATQLSGINKILTQDDFMGAISICTNKMEKSQALYNLIFSQLPSPAQDVFHTAFDVNNIRKDFPILNERINGNELIWFDNAATTQKPKKVIERIKYFYEHENSNVHRAAHTLAARTTEALENARKKIAAFINAASPDEIVFVRGATEGINLVAQAYGRFSLHEGDEVIITQLEHHANIVPWQMICENTGAILKSIPVDDDGQITLSEYQKLLNCKSKIVAFTNVSNSLGTVTPVKEMIEMAHRIGARVLVDGAQAAAHQKIDVQTLDCDFYVFSGHKVFGPTGIGVLYGKSELLSLMPPYQGGGNMISDVTLEETAYKLPPHKFEAGTGNIADAIALGSAVDYINTIGIENIACYEHALLEYAREAVMRIPGISIIGNAPDRISILSFILENAQIEEVGRALNEEGIAVRAGHHCSQPILRRFGLEGTVRASFALYNTTQEVDFFADVLKRIAALHN